MYIAGGITAPTAYVNSPLQTLYFYSVKDVNAGNNYAVSYSSGGYLNALTSLPTVLSNDATKFVRSSTSIQVTQAGYYFVRFSGSFAQQVPSTGTASPAIFKNGILQECERSYQPVNGYVYPFCLTLTVPCLAGDIFQFGITNLSQDGMLFNPSIYIEQKVFDYANLSTLNGLTDVLITSEQNGDILGWNSSISKYQNYAPGSLDIVSQNTAQSIFGQKQFISPTIFMSNNAAQQNVISCSNALGPSNILLGSQGLNTVIKNNNGIFSIASAIDLAPSIAIDRTNLVNTFG